MLPGTARAVGFFCPLAQAVAPLSPWVWGAGPWCGAVTFLQPHGDPDSPPRGRGVARPAQQLSYKHLFAFLPCIHRAGEGKGELWGIAAVSGGENLHQDLPGPSSVPGPSRRKVAQGWG